MIAQRFSRRTLLQGLGVGAAMLPLLHSERSAFAAPATFPKRLITVTWTNGIYQKNWLPANADLTTQPLPVILQPLETWKSKILIPRNVDLKVMVDAGRTYDGHFSYAALFSGASPVAKGVVGTAPSIDQIIGDALVKQGVNSPQLAIGCRNYGSSTTWAAAGKVNNAETDPFHLFDTLFGGKDLTSTQMNNLRKRRQSVLDLVGKELTTFGARLGTDDKFKVQAHLDAIRALEKDLEAATGSQVACTPPTLGAKVDFKQVANYPTHVDLMMKLAAVAIKCDIARAVTIDLINDGGGDSLTFPWLNIGTSDYHALAHLGTSAATQKTSIDQWFYKQVATLVGQLDGAAEGAKTALDNSVVVVANDMSEGNYHSVTTIPYLLVGSCGDFFKTGRVVTFKGGIPNNKLLTTLCHAMGVQVASVGNGYAGDCDVNLTT